MLMARVSRAWSSCRRRSPTSRCRRCCAQARLLHQTAGRRRGDGVHQRRDARAGRRRRGGGRAVGWIPGYQAPCGVGASPDRLRQRTFAVAAVPAQACGMGRGSGGGRLPAADAFVAHGPFGPHGGASALAKLLDTVPVTAVICSSDQMAIGVLREAHRRGCRCQGTCPWSASTTSVRSYCSPSLTTLAQPIDEMAAAAVDDLLQRLDPDSPRRGTGSTAGCSGQDSWSESQRGHLVEGY